MNTYDTEIADVRRMNPVDAGLWYAANELELAQRFKVQADERYKRALADFQIRYGYYGAIK